ncbi:DUF4350 domain-containing protein [Flammeovirga aprica]|uniref:DUF4350 domain-containing protein n=1 Tax=Flammeovirga aprica JL-4 TaxID=694437 RepID=A0A7X9XBL4_9BACT|nr:DUF4350 domain-containing protein [Flammeovirga aprica]NME70870.1 DUF4350 domain-containing protein [Flammeovirga aprica JL-4]
MKKFNKQYLILIFAVVLYLVISVNSKNETNWTAHYNSNSKDPYGTKALMELLKDEEMKMNIKYSRSTAYEILVTDKEDYSTENLFIVGKKLTFDKESVDAMLQSASSGNTIIIATEKLNHDMTKALGVELDIDYSNISIKEMIQKKDFNFDLDTTLIEFNEQKGYFSSFDMTTSFDKYDTLDTEVLARNTNFDAVFLKKNVDQGAIYLLSIPKVFTNIALLHNDNHLLVNEIIKEFPEGDYIKTEYYSLGRKGHNSPLRVLLGNDGLREAVYLLLLIIFIYLIFEAKREQRPIPNIIPPKNESLKFVNTLGQLYLGQKNNKNILDKRKQYLLNHILNKYNINLNKQDNWEDLELLSFRSGIEIEKIKKLFISLDKLVMYSMSDESFKNVNELIDDFYSNEI